MTRREIESRILQFLGEPPVAEGVEAQRIADAVGVPRAEVLAPLTILVAEGEIDTFGIAGVRWYRMPDRPAHLLDQDEALEEAHA